MDPLSQGVIGGLVGMAGAKKHELGRACTIAFLSGMAADLDVLIRDSSDAFWTLDMHRHFTHSLTFVPVGGLLCAGVAWLLYHKHLSFKRIYLFAFLGYATHALLDACTSYGTRLWLPFSNERVAWDNLSIIDPLYTLPLLGLMLWAALARKTRILPIALAFMLSYPLLGLWQNHRASTFALSQLAAQNITPERLRASPSIGNNVLWRIQYQHQGRIYAAGVYQPWWGAPKWYAGESLLVWQPQHTPLAANSPQAQDLAIFTHFADGWLVQIPNHPNRVGDARYSILPNLMQPMWQIELKPQQAQQHADFVRQERGQGKPLPWGTFFNMLQGKPIAEE